MNIEQKLYQAAIDLIEKRYPSGWGGAAAMYTEDGLILTSVSPDVINASTELCIETGAILEAHNICPKLYWTITINCSSKVCRARYRTITKYTING